MEVKKVTGESAANELCIYMLTFFAFQLTYTSLLSGMDMLVDSMSPMIVSVSPKSHP